MGSLTQPESATVEVLTAEVRVLMVGSRQITLSVARQLDDVDPEEMDPFGRITTGRKSGPRESVIEAIGSQDGVLVRANVSRERMTCRGNANRHYGSDGDQYLPCDREDDHQLHHWLYYYPDRQMWDEWQALPLIVLAGLR